MIIYKLKQMNILFIILISLIVKLETRRISRQITGPQFRRDNSFIFLDRIIVQKGQVNIQFQVTLTTPKNYISGSYQVQLLMISNELWQLAHQNSDYCSWRLSFVTTNNQKQKQMRSFKVKLDKQSNLVGKISDKLYVDQESTYHIFAADCKKTLINQHFNKKTIIGLKADIQNSGQIHGQDEQIYSWFLPVIIIASILLYRHLRQQDQQYKQSNYPRILLQISIVIHIVSLSISLFNHLLYISVTGNQSTALGFIQAIVDPASDCFLLSLLTLLAYGWFTKHKQLHDNQIYYVIASMISICIIILNILTKVNDHSLTKYHFHDTIPSKILIGLRILSLILFYVGLGLMMDNLKWRKNPKKKEAFANYQLVLALIGSMAFLDMPVIVFASESISMGWRQSFVFVGCRLSRFILLLIMGYQVKNKKSAYKTVCIIDQSFLDMQNKYI